MSITMYIRRGGGTCLFINKVTSKCPITMASRSLSVGNSLVTKKLDLFLVRHAESNNNMLNNLIKGDDKEEQLLIRREADCGVSPRGRGQLRLLSEYVCAGGWNDILQRPTTFYSSPMLRCLETADALTSGLPQDKAVIMNVKHDLYEVGGCYKLKDGANVGLPGNTSEEVETRYSSFKCLPGMETGWYPRANKETREEFHCRVGGLAEWVWELVGRTSVAAGSVEEGEGSNQVVLVAHGHLITTLMNYLLFGVPQACLFVHHNTGVTHLQLTVLGDHDQRVGVVQSCNQTDHLHSPQPLATAALCSSDGSGNKVVSLRSGNELVKDRWAKIFS
jgi:broad specificity phosphatase PhoE